VVGLCSAQLFLRPLGASPTANNGGLVPLVPPDMLSPALLAFDLPAHMSPPAAAAANHSTAPHMYALCAAISHGESGGAPEPVPTGLLVTMVAPRFEALEPATIEVPVSAGTGAAGEARRWTVRVRGSGFKV